MYQLFNLCIQSTRVHFVIVNYSKLWLKLVKAVQHFQYFRYNTAIVHPKLTTFQTKSILKLQQISKFKIIIKLTFILP